MFGGLNANGKSCMSNIYSKTGSRIFSANKQARKFHFTQRARNIYALIVIGQLECFKNTFKHGSPDPQWNFCPEGN